MADLVTVSKVRDVISGAEMRTDSALPEALDQCVRDLLDGAVKRAQENGRKTVRPEDLAGRPSRDATSLTVASRVKGAVSEQDLRSDSNLVDALNAHIQAVLDEAIERAKANGRSTVRPYDLPALR